MSEAQQAKDLKEAEELLGQFTDLAVKIRPIRKWPSEVRTGQDEAYCIYCNDTARTPPNVAHKHGCVVARALDFLRKRL